jgi:hypothetical protein
MATAATRRENNDVPRTSRINLIPTCLLMEGLSAQTRGWVDECNGDFSPTTTQIAADC